MSTKYYEESEYYVKEYEVRNGLGRESTEQEQRTRGTPFESSLRYERPAFARESRLRDDFPDLQRFRDDLDSRFSRARSSYPTSGYASMDRRQQSLPPIYRSSHYDYPTYSSTRIPPVPTTTYPYTSTTEPYRPYPSETYRSTTIQHDPIYRPPTDAATHHSYRPSITTPIEPQVKHSRGPSLITTSRPGSPQPVAGAGDIQNTEEGFTIHLDVKHFEPKDIKVSLVGNTLTVTGDRIEDDPTSEQTLKRSFSRKYAIPDDIRLETVKSFMTDNGFLIIRGNRKTWKETEINVHFNSSHPNAPASNV
uniref:SHSP domain-containing protein n=1 Tax=Acrobeloides nanus TaxID=290746 RepID=A0A914D742_9BILA